MSSKVYFAKVTEDMSRSEIREGLNKILGKEEIIRNYSSEGITGIKMHFGEADKPNTVSPDMVKVIADNIKQKGARPFLTDTNTLYVGQRADAVNHLNLAYRHGYTIEATGAPVVILDGIRGRSFSEIPVDYEICDKVKIASDVLSMDDLIVVTHVTGHGGAGLGGSIKNVGMGMSSRGGKQVQHSGILPTVNKSNCIGCGECAKWCPADAITVEDTAEIDSSLCIGCGECTATCRYNAISIRWDESSENLQKKMAEHTAGVLNSINGKAVFLNFLLNITEDCDCLRRKQETQFRAIGILGSTDIVAVDRASFDLLEKKAGEDIIKSWTGKNGTIQMQHGEKIGIGSTDYTLEEV